MKQSVEQAYELAKQRYAAIGVDTDKVLEQMQNFHISMHCWQADDVAGFENQGGSLTGGIQVNGNYPGKARNIDELRADILYAKSLIPGTHRLNLHEIYGDFQGKFVDRDQVDASYFQSWIQWGLENNTKLDFNSTSFSHPKSGDLSLSSPDKGVRDFWIEHSKRCRAISEEIGKAQNDPCIMNTWVHDGSKDMTVNRMLYRELLKDSLDQIFAQKYDNMKDCVESKVFGIGLESYTVGSNDFYTSYAAQNDMMITLDNGHFHPTKCLQCFFSFPNSCFTYLVQSVGTQTTLQSWTTPLWTCSAKSYVLTRLTAFTTALTTSTARSTVSAHTLSVHALPRSACSAQCSNRLQHFANTRPKTRNSNVSPFSKNAKPCLGTLFTTCSASRTMFPLAKHSFPKFRNTNAKLLQNATKA